MNRVLQFLMLLTCTSLGVCDYAGAQCVTIAGLPDTIDACKNTTVPLSATVAPPASGPLVTLDTFWTPTTGLSNANIINPVATVGTTSQMYHLNVTALTPTNYVTNGNFSSGNTGFSTAYILGTGGSFGLLSNEGTYAVSTNPSVVHTNFANFPDHTGNAGGQMLIVNGSATPNTSVWCQTITVLPNTQYDFSAWGASCVSSNPAILQFSIDGVLLGTPLALPTTTGTWVQFHAIWNSGTSTSITICVVDQATAPSGNDFAIDDIEFRQICTATDSVYIRVTDLRPAITTNLRLGCTSDSVDFTAVNNGDIASGYVWDFGDGQFSQLQNPTHGYPTQGQYTVKLVTKKRGCSDSATVVIDTRHPISASLTSDKDSICLGEAIAFDNSGDRTTTTATYFYDYGNGVTGTTSNPSYTYPAVGVYNVVHVVSDQIPCTDTARKTVVVVEAPTASFTASDSSLCAGLGIDFLASASIDYDTLRWNFGDGTVIPGAANIRHAYDSGGVFTVTLTVGYPQCPTINLTKEITVHPYPHVNIGEDTSICPNGGAIPITNRINNPGIANLWSTGETGSSILITQPGDYWLRNTTDKGCSAADSIHVANACYLDVPNAFSPNNDGLNDYFFPRQFLSSRLTYFKMQVYDRWGQVIFETNKLDGRGWDGYFNGKRQPQGVYIYLIEARIEGGGIQKYQGNVTLLN